MEYNGKLQAVALLLYKRTEKNLSLRQAGKLLGVSANFLGELEKGNKIPSDYLIYKLSELYGLSQDILFNGFNKNPILGGIYEEVKDSKRFKELIREIAISKVNEDTRQLLYDNIFDIYRERRGDI